MNLKEYYHAISIEEAAIAEDFVLIVSLPTANGGRGGIVSEVNRTTAAKLIVDKQARLSTPEEARQVREDQNTRQRQKDVAALQERVRMTRLAEDELRALKKALHPTRKGA